MARIPAMTTGIIDFMINSGRITLIAAIPVPLLAVPYAAPRAIKKLMILLISLIYSDIGLKSCSNF